MSRWTESWRDFVRETSYKQILAGEKISEDQFWRSYAVYDRILSYSGYPGEILLRISSEIPAQINISRHRGRDGSLCPAPFPQDEENGCRGPVRLPARVYCRKRQSRRA